MEIRAYTGEGRADRRMPTRLQLEDSRHSYQWAWDRWRNQSSQERPRSHHMDPRREVQRVSSRRAWQAVGLIYPKPWERWLLRCCLRISRERRSLVLIRWEKGISFSTFTFCRHAQELEFVVFKIVMIPLCDLVYSLVNCSDSLCWEIEKYGFYGVYEWSVWTLNRTFYCPLWIPGRLREGQF